MKTLMWILPLLLFFLSAVPAVRSFLAPALTLTLTRPSRNSARGETVRLQAAYGLATPASRILTEVVSASKGRGYYRAREDEQVMAVVVQITEGSNGDIALVYANGQSEQNSGSALLGIFTETDYINVRNCSAKEHPPRVINPQPSTLNPISHPILFFFLIVFYTARKGVHLGSRVGTVPARAHFTIPYTHRIAHFHLAIHHCDQCTCIDAEIQRPTFNSCGYSHPGRTVTPL